MRELRSQGKPLTPKLERERERERETGKYREQQLIGAETHQQQPPWEPVPGRSFHPVHRVRLSRRQDILEGKNTV